MSSTIADYVGKRVLLKGQKYGQEVEEARVLEISPSGSYVRLMNAYGTKRWTLTTSVAILEALVLPEPYPRSGT